MRVATPEGVEIFDGCSAAVRSRSTWAVCAYFNSARFRTRLDNYHLFRARLDVPLLTIALEFSQEPEIKPGDADIVVRLREGDVLWQKERLYNEALKWLPPSCSRILWLDADIIFPEPDWLEKVDRELDRWPVAQAFRRLWLAPPGWKGPATPDCPTRAADELAVAHCWMNRKSRQHLRGTSNNQAHPLASIGVAWATRRSFIESARFFDKMVIGSGDIAFWCGVSGDHLFLKPEKRTPAVVEHWREWQRRAFAMSEGRLGCVDSPVISLWHGDHRNRHYHDRWRILQQSNFDPATDIRVSPHGAWVWSSDKPVMHRAVERYFAQRLEDTPLPVRAPASNSPAAHLSPSL